MKPIIGLSPMDGVTDAAFRYIVDTYGKSFDKAQDKPFDKAQDKPDILYTEFVSVKGMAVGKPAMFRMLLKHETKTPTIAQLFGNDPQLFYAATEKIIKLGFNGVDINMGCPDDSVTKRGGGASLIDKPELAIKIIKTVQKSVKYLTNTKSKKFTVSVKTRTGIKTHQTKEWISRLLEIEPDMICLHGRTLEQKYSGRASWEEIGLAAQLAKNTRTKILGNGDIKSRKEALEKIEKYKLAGVLIGRGALGNPWIFQGRTPTLDERIKVILGHCQKFNEFFPKGDFKAMRKHLVWYAKGFRNSAKVRNELMKVNNINDVESIFSSILV